MFGRLFGVQNRTIQASTWGQWPGDIVPTWAGQRVDRESSLQLLAVYGCVRLISDSIATMPIEVFRSKPDGTRESVNRPLWLTNPTSDLDYVAWVTQILSSLLLQGNAYVAVIRASDTGRILELVPLDPDKVHVRREGARKVILVNGKEYPGDLLHIKGCMLPGSDVGMSPIEYARQSIGVGLSATEHGGRFFAQGVNLSGVIEYPDKLNPDRMTEIAKQWSRKYSGRKNAHMPAVLDGGATWRATSITNKDAQFLETRNFTAAEIAGQMFLVEPTDLGITVQGSRITYANVVDRATHRVQVTLLPWIVRIESALSSLLARPQFVKINVDGLLRGDSSQRWTNYKTAMDINAAAMAVGQPPVLTTTEMRDFEDYGPLDASQIPDYGAITPSSVPAPDLSGNKLPEQIVPDDSTSG